MHMATVRSSATSLIVLNILDTCKKTYLIENRSTETEAEYQWMHGAYIHVTGSNAKAQCRTFHYHATLFKLSTIELNTATEVDT